MPISQMIDLETLLGFHLASNVEGSYPRIVLQGFPASRVYSRLQDHAVCSTAFHPATTSKTRRNARFVIGNGSGSLIVSSRTFTSSYRSRQIY